MKFAHWFKGKKLPGKRKFESWIKKDQGNQIIGFEKIMIKAEQAKMFRAETELPSMFDNNLTLKTRITFLCAE